MQCDSSIQTRFVIEPLEGRQLLAATATPLASEPAAPFIAKINFQPAGAAVPGGYLVDSGEAYASRGNGFTYGWSSSNRNAVDRNSTRSPDQRHDTFVRNKSTTLTWSLAVPNGRYIVGIVSGVAAGGLRAAVFREHQREHADRLIHLLRELLDLHLALCK